MLRYGRSRGTGRLRGVRREARPERPTLDGSSSTLRRKSRGVRRRPFGAALSATRTSGAANPTYQTLFEVAGVLWVTLVDLIEPAHRAKIQRRRASRKGS